MQDKMCLSTHSKAIGRPFFLPVDGEIGEMFSRSLTFKIHGGLLVTSLLVKRGLGTRVLALELKSGNYLR